MSRTVDEPVTDHVVDHVVVHRMSYYIYFLLVYAVQMPLRIKKMHKLYQVFDVMLHTVSPPRGEAASPPLQDVLPSKKAVT
jgi:ABC-type microcin C transport system permease subunit YejB